MTALTLSLRSACLLSLHAAVGRTTSRFDCCLLTGRCLTRDCSKERLYVGRMARQSEVLLQAGHKWNNALFHNHTGLRVYPKYAMGGGYVLSGDVVDALVGTKVPRRPLP